MSALRWRMVRAWGDRGDRGATLVEYAMIIALVVVVCMAAISRLQASGEQRLAASDDRITPAADRQYYAGGGVPPSPPPTPAPPPPGAIAVHLASSPAVVVENEGNNWRVTVTFTLLDSSANGVIGASMHGTWTDGGNGSTPSGTCSTSTSAGQCTLQFTEIKDNVPTVTFTLTSITGGGFFWVPEEMGEGVLTVGCPGGAPQCD